MVRETGKWVVEALGKSGHLAVATPKESVDERGVILQQCDVSWIVEGT